MVSMECFSHHHKSKNPKSSRCSSKGCVYSWILKGTAALSVTEQDLKTY